jgi:hypothetical protein
MAVSFDEDKGRYSVELDGNNKQLSLKVDNLSIQDSIHVGTGDTVDAADLDNLESGAIVCKAHRLQVCAACGIDLATLNSDRAARAAAAAQHPLCVTGKQLGAPGDGLKNLDPSLRIVDTRARSEWGGRGPLEQAFRASLSLAERCSLVRPTVEEDLTFQVRVELVSIARMFELDKCRWRTIQADDNSVVCFYALSLTSTKVLALLSMKVQMLTIRAW